MHVGRGGRLVKMFGCWHRADATWTAFSGNFDWPTYNEGVDYR
jgi:hypothetical protein